MTDTEKRNLIARFRLDSPNLTHCDTWDAMEEMGGATAIIYGRWMGIPKQYTFKKRCARLDVADSIERTLR